MNKQGDCESLIFISFVFFLCENTPKFHVRFIVRNKIVLAIQIMIHLLNPTTAVFARLFLMLAAIKLFCSARAIESWNWIPRCILRSGYKLAHSSSWGTKTQEIHSRWGENALFAICKMQCCEDFVIQYILRLTHEVGPVIVFRG